MSKARQAADEVNRQQAGRRNLIINGAMQVTQRTMSATGITSSGYKSVDRHKVDLSSLGTWTHAQSTDAPNGFANSLKFTCTTADASPAAGDYIISSIATEAQNLQSLAYGTSDAKALTLSFWVKSNKTGAASLEFQQIDNSSKRYTTSYTINSADTWEYKTITVPGDTAGAINNDTGNGLWIGFWLNSGSTYTGGSLSESWQTVNSNQRNASNLGLGGSTSDYWQITGVQLEVGDVATPFEHRSYGEELALCQRYFYRHSDQQYSYGDRLHTDLRTTMRANPTITVTAGSSTVNRAKKNFVTFNSYTGNIVFNADAEI